MNNEEQMRSDFDAAFPFEKHGYALTELHWKVWQAATASKQREIDVLRKDVTRLHYQHESERELNDVLQSQVNRLNQQVLELSEQVEVMREALTMMLEAGESEYGEDWFAAAMNGRQALSIHQSAALAYHDNEVAVKVLEELRKRETVLQADGRPRCFVMEEYIEDFLAERRNRK